MNLSPDTATALFAGLKDSAFTFAKENYTVALIGVGIIAYVAHRLIKTRQQRQITLEIQALKSDVKAFIADFKLPTFFFLSPYLKQPKVTRPLPSNSLETMLVKLEKKRTEQAELQTTLGELEKTPGKARSRDLHTFQTKAAKLKTEIKNLTVSIILIEAEKCKEEYALRQDNLENHHFEEESRNNANDEGSSVDSNKSLRSQTRMIISPADAKEKLETAIQKLEELCTELRTTADNLAENKITDLQSKIYTQMAVVGYGNTLFQLAENSQRVKLLIKIASEFVANSFPCEIDITVLSNLSREFYLLSKTITPGKYDTAQENLKERKQEISYYELTIAETQKAYDKYKAIQELEQNTRVQHRQQPVQIVYREAQNVATSGDTPTTAGKKPRKTWTTRLKEAKSQLGDLQVLPQKALTVAQRMQVTQLKTAISHFERGARKEKQLIELRNTFITFLEEITKKRSNDPKILGAINNLLTDIRDITNVVKQFNNPPPLPGTIKIEPDEIDDETYQANRRYLEEQITVIQSVYMGITPIEKALKRDVEMDIKTFAEITEAKLSAVKETILDILTSLSTVETQIREDLKAKLATKAQQDKAAKEAQAKEARHIANIRKEQESIRNAINLDIKSINAPIKKMFGDAMDSAKKARQALKTINEDVAAHSEEQQRITELRADQDILKEKKEALAQKIQILETQLKTKEEEQFLYIHAQKAEITDSEIQEVEKAITIADSAVKKKKTSIVQQNTLVQTVEKAIDKINEQLRYVRLEPLYAAILQAAGLNISSKSPDNLTLPVYCSKIMTLHQEFSDKAAGLTKMKASASYWENIKQEWNIITQALKSLLLTPKQRTTIFTLTGVDLGPLYKAVDNVNKVLRDEAGPNFSASGSIGKFLEEIQKAVEEIKKTETAIKLKMVVSDDTSSNKEPPLPGDSNPAEVKIQEIIKANTVNAGDDEDKLIPKKNNLSKTLEELQKELTALEVELQTLLQQQSEANATAESLNTTKEAILLAKTKTQGKTVDVLARQEKKLKAELQAIRAVQQLSKDEFESLTKKLLELEGELSKLTTKKLSLDIAEKERREKEYQSSLFTCIQLFLQEEFFNTISNTMQNATNPMGVVLEKNGNASSRLILKQTEINQETHAKLILDIATVLSEYGTDCKTIFSIYELPLPDAIAQLQLNNRSSMFLEQLDNLTQLLIHQFAQLIRQPTSLRAYLEAKSMLVVFQKMNNKKTYEELLLNIENRLEKPVNSQNPSENVSPSKSSTGTEKPSSAATPPSLSGSFSLDELKTTFSSRKQISMERANA